MEPLVESIELDPDKINELLFKVNVEGDVHSPVIVRLVCEGPDMGYVFKGLATQDPGVVWFHIPESGKNSIIEGKYAGHVEVIVDGKHFTPVQFDLIFKRPLRVVAESYIVKEPPAKEVAVSAVQLQRREEVHSKQPVPVTNHVMTPVKSPLQPLSLKNRYLSKKS